MSHLNRPPSRSAGIPREAERHARAAALAPVIRGLASTDRPQVGHYTDSDVVLDFLSRTEHPRLAVLGTSCPDHFLRTKVRPMVLDLPPDAPLEDVVARLRELHAAYRADYAAYYQRYADAVFALTGGDLSQTTGLHIPVDSGVAAGFLR